MGKTDKLHKFSKLDQNFEIRKLKLFCKACSREISRDQLSHVYRYFVIKYIINIY